MTPSFPTPRLRTRGPLMIATCGLLVLTACDEPLDFDLRGIGGGFTTAQAAQNATADRPRPDARGVISYPNYQVAVARRGDTLTDVASRVGLPPNELGRYNGIEPDVPLRAGEVIALPRRVAEPSPATGAIGTGPIQPSSVDVTTLAGNAIDNAAPTPATAAPTASLPQTGQEPIRHRVERGETAFTIARLYQVPAKSLAEWNGLGADFAVREGQFLLIPVARVAAPPRNANANGTTAPGSGTPTPLPPSAAKPLPEDDTANPPPGSPDPDKPTADVGETTTAAKPAQMALPVQGNIIREYAKGRNEGIDIKAAPGSPVKAATGGTVAAITKSAEGVPIIVIRHPGNLLTVYANVDGVQVAKGDTVRRGQAIAKLRSADDDAFVHFEVRDGFDSVDPGPFLK
ncbi:peptidoglycan DD-metalloendopeptidase family protein [uncultured Tateyamaria sp.]|uniref:peptidoglycan DD-metalloendopeptidase family protein n=1 Tax=uncultured Tateyamaria sp. TaxID=455651 RepID=UPI0026295E8F|nr:peptidoglycan DD-metalloendopeptidase family protein [uncultured Tateyamaria sp.]